MGAIPLGFATGGSDEFGERKLKTGYTLLRPQLRGINPSSLGIGAVHNVQFRIVRVLTVGSALQQPFDFQESFHNFGERCYCARCYFFARAGTPGTSAETVSCRSGWMKS